MAQHKPVERSTIPAPTGRSEWTAWLAATVAGAAALSILYATFSPEHWWGDYMTWLIALLFLWILFKSRRHINFLDRETRIASEQVSLLEQHNDLDRFLADARPSVFRSHIASLHTIFLNDSNISQDSLIEITHARLAAQNRVVDLLSGMLITLGLIGTIIGLLMSVGGLGSVLSTQGGGTDDLKIGMKKTLDGLGTAFYTTLFGAVGGGVILRILTAVVDSHILRYVAHLSELTEVHVLPALRRTAARLEASGYYKRLDEG